MQNDNKINPQIYIIWTENQKFRVFANLYRSYLDKIFRRENIKDKCGKIPQETVGNYLNSWM